MGQHELWVEQYTPLLAEHKEIDTFVGQQSEADEIKNKFPVSDIPKKGHISFLLGESGAGKTTSLWEIVVRFCRQLVNGVDVGIPVLCSLRAWSPDRSCRELFQDQFSLLDIPHSMVERYLKNGSFLVLFDGINEVKPEHGTQCNQDIAKFISLYRDNSYVISCRSSDFDLREMPIKEIRPPLPDSIVYEICRLDKAQIIEYSKFYFSRYSISPNEFFELLEIDDDDVWENQTSPVQLARIPLYLQIFLDVFRKTGQLPNGRTMLLKALVNRILSREIALGKINIDSFANERMLGSLSFQSTESGYSLRFPRRYAQEHILSIFEVLRSQGIIANNVTFGDVWRDILSANFLKSVTEYSLEWLHQLIRDYFLGTEYARIWTGGNELQRENLKERLRGFRWDMAITIALGLLDERAGATFLWSMMHMAEENAKKAFENQPEGIRRGLMNSLVFVILEKGDFDTNDFKIISHILPYPETVDAMDSNFYSTNSVEMRALLIEGIAEMIVEHLPKLELYESYFFESYKLRFESKKKAIKRSQELLRKYLKNENGIVSLYAVKGLWEHDRSAAAEQLKKLTSNQDPDVISRVHDLIEELGIH